MYLIGSSKLADAKAFFWLQVSGNNPTVPAPMHTIFIYLGTAFIYVLARVFLLIQ